jgi:hypothetical protein
MDQPMQHVQVPLIRSPDGIAQLIALAHGAVSVMKQGEKTKFKARQGGPNRHPVYEHFMRGAINEKRWQIASALEVLSNLLAEVTLENLELKRSDCDGIAGGQYRGMIDRSTVDVNSISTIEIGDLIAALYPAQARVVARDENAIENEVRIGIAPDNKRVPQHLNVTLLACIAGDSHSYRHTRLLSDARLMYSRQCRHSIHEQG